jgi:hypothetical protein
MTAGKMMTDTKSIEEFLGFSPDKIDAVELKKLVVESFMYHEQMADASLGAINKKDAEGTPVNNKSALWQSFEMNNTISFALKEILNKSVKTK